ncbi:MAG: glutathione transferase GstA [Pseudomonadota bacterium]
MKLFYSPGACSLASHIILNELDYQYELEKTDTRTSTTESGINYLSVNPNGYVPALQTDDGDVITENPAILQYLADNAPESGLAPPNGSFARTRLQELLNFLSSELHKAYSPFFSGQELDDDEASAVHKKIARRVTHIEQRLADGRAYLLGTDFSVADAYAFVVLGWSQTVNFDLGAFPKVKSYLKRIVSRPAVERALIEEGLIEARQAS